MVRALVRWLDSGWVCLLLPLFWVPTAHADTIELCGGLYRYIDAEFMRAHTTEGCMGVRWPRAGEPLGYTLSTTPPDAEVEFIQEVQTICTSVGPEVNRVVSSGRRIPRYRVTGKPHEVGNYVIDGARRDSCREVAFRPPRSAARPPPEMLARQPPITHGETIEGAPFVQNMTALLRVGRKLIRLYGITGFGEPATRIAQRLLGSQPVVCRAVDLGGYRCMRDGLDVSELLIANGLARAMPQAPAPLQRAQAEAQAEKRGFWGIRPGR